MIQDPMTPRFNDEATTETVTKVVTRWGVEIIPSREIVLLEQIAASLKRLEEAYVPKAPHQGETAVRIRKMDGAAAQGYLDAIDLSKCRREDGATDPQ